MSIDPIERIPLRFGTALPPDDFRDHLSACCLVPTGDRNGRLWLACDEGTGLSSLSSAGTARGSRARSSSRASEPKRSFEGHVYLDLAQHLDLPNGPDEEIDIEGLDFDEGRLWFVGSHTGVRGKARPGESVEEALEPLSQLSSRPNRCLLGCLRLEDGMPVEGVAAEYLPMDGGGNALTRALRKDPHLGPFLRTRNPRHSRRLQIPSKENGFDIEGLAVRGDRLLLGLRGPVLRGWAALLELEVQRKQGKGLGLKRIGPDGRRYRKHFLDLGGMGIRDLAFQGGDLLILSGPTMDHAGRQCIYRLRDPLALGGDSLTERGDRLECLLDLPFVTDGDKAEGLCLYEGLDEPAVLVVFDDPAAERRIDPDGVLADVFRLT